MSVCGHWHPTPEPCTIVSLDGIDMVSSGAGLFGLTAPIDGWANSGISTGGPVPWETADGGIMGDTPFQGRSLTIEGDIEAATHEEFAEAVEQLGSVLTYKRTAMLEVDETVHLGLVRQIEVTRVRPVQITALGPRHGIFTMQLEAADFLRTSVDENRVVVTTAGVDLRNIGNARADLLIEMKGYLSKPGLTWPGGSWNFDASIGDGKMIQSEMTPRKVYAPETGIHYRQYAKGTWLQLPPGVTRIKRVGTGAGTITAVWRSSWS